MGIGMGIVLLIVGLILVSGAINLPSGVTDVMDPVMVGWILIIGAVLTIVLALVMNSKRNTAGRPPQRPYDQ